MRGEIWNQYRPLRDWPTLYSQFKAELEKSEYIVEEKILA